MNTIRKMDFPLGKETLPSQSLPAPCPGKKLLFLKTLTTVRNMMLSFLIDDYIKI